MLDGSHGLAYNVTTVKITDRPKAGKDFVMKKLWKVTVNEFGWKSPKTLYFESYEAARKEWALHTAADDVKYAGCFTDEHAHFLLSDFVDQNEMLSYNRDLRNWFFRSGVER